MPGSEPAPRPANGAAPHANGAAYGGPRLDGRAAAIPLGPQEEPLVDRAHAASSPQGGNPPPANDAAPGTALVVADFTAPRLSASDWLARTTYRLGLAKVFRRSVPLRLVATVSDPLPGDRVAGGALLGGHLLIYGTRLPLPRVEWNGPRLVPAVERVVHGFGWLADLAAATPREAGAPLAERLLRHWLDANPRPDGTPAWDIDNTGQRLIAWLIHAPLVLSSDDKAFRTRVLHALADTTGWLERNVTRAEDKFGEAVGWAAITAAGLLLADGHARRLHGEAGLLRALGEAIAPDGGLRSRNPLAQLDAIALITRLIACYRAVSIDPPEQLDAILSALVPPVLTLLHSDGGLGSWQSAHAVAAAKVAGIVAASGVRTRPLRQLDGWDYYRIVAGRSVLQFDGGPPPSARHARDGCASTLAFELSCGGHRLIVNCGGAAAAGRSIPAAAVQGLRATAAHSTLTIEELNSTAVLINGQLGEGVTVVPVDDRPRPLDRGHAERLEATHNGYVKRFGLLHRRVLLMRDDGTELRGEDVLEQQARKGKRGNVNVALRFHLGPDIAAALGEDGFGASLALPDGSLWQFRSGGEPLALEDSLWFDGHGHPQATRQLVILAKAPRSGASFSWLLKKMR